VDKLHDQHGLAHAGAAEQTDLATARERAEQVDDLDAGLELLQRHRLLLQRRRLAVDGHGLGLHRRHAIDGLAEHVEHAPQRLGPDRHRDRRAGILDCHAAHQAVGGGHGDAAHEVVAQMLGDLAVAIDNS
jgi:hypothetical protein